MPIDTFVRQDALTLFDPPLPDPDGVATACYCCSRYVSQSRLTEVASGDEVCPTCLDVLYRDCDRCSDAVLAEDMTTVRDGGVVCDDCRQAHYTSCDRCDDYVEDEDITQTVRGSDICPSCLSNWYYQCVHCDGWNRDGNTCGEGCDERYGDDDDDPEYSSELHDYSYKPYPNFQGTGPLFLGPEIEIETPRGDLSHCASIANRTLGSLGYLKRDSSIDYGFEMVTHPMSFEWAMENFPWDMLTELSRMGCSTDPYSNGIHVHVSRKGFSGASHSYRWLKFIYRNQNAVRKLARRSCGEWAAFNPDDRKRAKDSAKGARRGNRYSAVNVQNRETFELRMFASSLDVEEVKAAFQFAHASVEYTRQLSAADICRNDGWTWGAFTAWVDEHPEYEALAKQIVATGSTQAPPEPEPERRDRNYTSSYVAATPARRPRNAATLTLGEVRDPGFRPIYGCDCDLCQPANSIDLLF